MTFFLPSGFCHDTEKEKVVVGEFAQGNLTNWEKKVFAGESRYQLVQVDGQTVLKGEAKASASGLFKKIHIPPFSFVC